MSPKYDHITVKLSENDGNVFSIIGCVSREMRKNKVEQKEIDEFTHKALNSESYDKVLQLVFSYVHVI